MSYHCCPVNFCWPGVGHRQLIDMFNLLSELALLFARNPAILISKSTVKDQPTSPCGKRKGTTERMAVPFLGTSNSIFLRVPA